MNHLTRKFTNVMRIYREHGSSEIGRLIQYHALNNPRTRIPYVRLFEIFSNVMEIDGYQFSLNSPSISSAYKATLLLNKNDYERAEITCVPQFADLRLPVIEVGGGLGVVSCLTNRLLRDPEKHVVVEPNPDMCRLILKNRDRNRCSFTVMNRAIAYGADQITFYLHKHYASSSVNRPSDTSIRVETTKLSEIARQFQFDHFNLISDIEGGEYDLLQHEADTLHERAANIIIELHPEIGGQDKVEAFCHQLMSLGFQLLHQMFDTYVFRRVVT